MDLRNLPAPGEVAADEIAEAHAAVAAAIARVQAIKPCRESALALTKLQEAQMWLGAL